MRLRSTLTTLAVTGALVGGGAAIANAASGTSGSTGSTGSSGTHGTTPALKSTPTPPAKGFAPRGGHNCPHMGAGNGPRSGSSSSGSSFTPGYAPAPNV